VQSYKKILSFKKSLVLTLHEHGQAQTRLHEKSVKYRIGGNGDMTTGMCVSIHNTH